MQVNNRGYKKYLYKQFLRLRKNIQNRPKIFKFRRQKWLNVQRFLRRDLKFFRRYRFKDQFRFQIPRFRSRGNSFQRKFRQNLYDRKTFVLFYGGLKKNYFKKKLRNIIYSYKTKRYNYYTLKTFESRLDTTLYRVGFCYSIQNARQLILHGGVLVNGKIIKSKSFLLDSNDLISISSNLKVRKFIRANLLRANFWPVPPKHIVVNYKTLQFVFIFPTSYTYLPVFNHYLNIGSLLNNTREF